MKNKRLNPILISCAIIASLAISISINQVALKTLAVNFNVARAILAMEYGIFFKEEQESSLQTASESNFVPVITTPEPEEPQEPETQESQDYYIDLAESMHINDQTSKFYQLWQLLQNPIDLEIEANTNQPEILIVHTHGTESFANDDNYDYEATDDRRSTDKDLSIAVVAKTLAQNLNEYGIATVYCDEYHDYPEYNGSYDRSLESIESYLETYPTIKMVIDVHRDAIISASGQHTYTTVDIDGAECSQIMMVIGTNEGGLTHNDWIDNFNNAVNLQTYINEVDNGLMKDINLRPSRFNQHATSGSMLIEVGTSGNTLTQALNAIEVFSKDLAEYLLAQ